jgi:transcription elongation GreA/GreB family factor
MLLHAIIVEPKHGSHVVMGSVVTIVSGDTEKTYTIVGANEANPSAGLISSQSPLGSALWGKTAGDTATVPTPAGERIYTIVTVA